MKRLGIFFFYEKNGDVDDFITYYLRDLARNLTELIVVCNGKLSKQGRAAFEEFTDQIIVRENKGLDVWAYKTALDHYGWQRLSEFDEVVMTNSTLMGPVRPLKEMFDAMAERTNLDFWGLTIHHGAEGNPHRVNIFIITCRCTFSPTLLSTAKVHPEQGAAKLLGYHAHDRKLYRLCAAV